MLAAINQETWITLLTPLIVAISLAIQQWSSYRHKQLLIDNTNKTEATGVKVDIASRKVHETAEKLDLQSAKIEENTAKTEETERLVEESKVNSDSVQEELARKLDQIHCLINGRTLGLLLEAARYARLYADLVKDPAAEAAAVEAERQVRIAQGITECRVRANPHGP